MSALTLQASVCPVYELDSVNEDKLEELISQLGLKKHSKSAIDPCCVICRQNLFFANQSIGRNSVATNDSVSCYFQSPGIIEQQIKYSMSQLKDMT